MQQPKSLSSRINSDKQKAEDAFISGKPLEDSSPKNKDLMPWEKELDKTSASEKNVNVLLNEHYRESVKKLHTLSSKYNNGKHLMQLVLCSGIDNLIAELEQKKDQD
ncbi:hypothetical protein [Photobacterium toruni]|uniref:Uncharacterized protein n=1 Tax=Photobacterium toruni TaxID=1935446 RepID=A0A1T4UJR2_9GAMM|nr:hypothetical protein [Photobacterium toruni]SKA52914.1 hypothetical protein CZ814_03366 [Photobacterium toruni]